MMANTTSTPGFAQDIRPLFGEDDRDAMEFIFDLWDYNDVSGNAEIIFERLDDGSMPCDEPWPTEQIDLFRRWIDAGMLP
jgi:hypothetical protein